MDFMRQLVGIARTQGEKLQESKNDTHDDDEVYPLYRLDCSKALQSIIVTWTLRFDDVLDAEELQWSLAKVLEIGDWRKVGGRLRANSDGTLGVHVPRTFTTSRPAISYSHVQASVSIAEHPIAKDLPRATDGPSVQPGADEFRVFAARPDAPRTLQDFLTKDIPMLSLHITTFTDATLVALQFPHVLMDAMGQQALLRAWSLVLAGKEAEVPAFLGAREDVLAVAVNSEATETKETYCMKDARLQGFGLLSFGLRFAWGIIRAWNVEVRTIFWPKAAMARLRREATVADSTTEPGSFLSDGDLITAFMTRTISTSLPQPRPLTVLHPINARFRLPLLKNPPGLYLQNMALASFTLLPADTAERPLGWLAKENRRQLVQQTTPLQVLAQLRQHYEQPHGVEPGAVCGPAEGLLVPFTDWTRADFWNEINFEGAVVGGDKGDVRRGKITYHMASAMEHSRAVRNVVVILGKDHDGNYWLSGTFQSNTWKTIGEAVEKL